MGGKGSLNELINELINELMTRLFIEQPLALPGSANYKRFPPLKSSMNFCSNFLLVFWSVETSLLCIVGELAGGGSVGFSDR